MGPVLESNCNASQDSHVTRTYCAPVPNCRPFDSWAQQDVNLLPADQGTTWFSDTSPEAVQRRRHEAQANSHGLDALASVYASGMGDG